jgi:hypothetical protein
MAIFDAAIPLPAFPNPIAQCGLSAVIEEQGGALSLLGAGARPPASRISTTPLASRRRFRHRAAHEIRHRPPAGGTRTAQAAEGRRVALVAHPASVTPTSIHSLDALIAAGINVTAAFGPQHGLKGDKQDNMVETADETDPRYGIPVFSLYGEVRRPTGQMMSTADVFLFDLQDLGCRIYTFVTTLLYLLEEAAKHGKSVWVLDRPNPAGRPVEGTCCCRGRKASSAPVRCRCATA